MEIKSFGKLLITKLTKPVIFVILGASIRLIPHPANFAPVAAMALFGGTYMKKREALAIPILIMVLSDLFLGFDSPEMRLTVYGAFIIAVFIGFWLKKHINLKNLIVSSLFSSAFFFLVTNFGVWAYGAMYTKSIGGLIDCYTLALPFFRNTILGDLFYTGAIFGSYNLIKNLVSLSPSFGNKRAKSI